MRRLAIAGLMYHFYDNTRKHMKITESSEKEAMLIHYAGGECRRLLKKLEKPKEGDKYVKAKSALTSYFSPKMNRVYLMNCVQQLKQKAGETMDSFHMHIKEKVTPNEAEKT